MPFFKELRRRKTSSKSDISPPNGSTASNESNGTVPTTKSSSTLSSLYGSNSTPASSIQPNQSNPNLALTNGKLGSTVNPPPQRPVALGGAMASNRNSVADSPGTYDAVPERAHREGHDLAMAIRKYRMAAYLWQAFTGEQMFRNGFGRRCFRFEEEWQTGSITIQDRASGQMRSEAKIHVVRSAKTVKELRDLNVAQQYDKATQKGDLFSIAMEDMQGYFQPAPGQKQYVSVLLLDAHWDSKVKTITGHAAIGGGANNIQIAVFGSQAMQSYPSCLEEVVPAFTDCTRTDTNFVANDCNESGSSWEAANIGIGAHLHEVGHMLGCPHQESGIMLRDYVTFNRTFTCREPYSTRTKSPGMRLCLPKDECGWHRLDTLRFRYHPCFRLPADNLASGDESVRVWPLDGGKVIVTAPTGIAFIEIFTDTDSTCHAWLDYCKGDGLSNGPPRQIVLTENDIKPLLAEGSKKRRLRLSIHSVGQGDHNVEDFGQLMSKTSIIKLPNGQTGFKGSQLGTSQQADSQPQQLILESAIKQSKLLTSIKIYHGFAIDGIEFCYEDLTSQLFGKRGGQPGGSEFALGW
ncbi:MAG: hypothetical protein Q9222_001113 [Ikaeria aurantiellina]